MSLLIKLKSAIKANIHDASVQILDPNKDERHLQAIVISESFKGLSLLERHKKVMEAIKIFFSGSLHAISIKTYTPDEVKKINE